MPRRNFSKTETVTETAPESNGTEPTTENTVTEETTVSTATEENPVEVVETETTESTEAPAAEATPEPVDTAAFEAAVTAAFEARNEDTGIVPEDFTAKVVEEYRALPGARGKAAAKKILQAGMEAGVKALDMPHARVYIDLQKVCVPASTSGSSTPREPKAPVDPAEGAAARLAILRLAHNAAPSTFEDGLEGVEEKTVALVEAHQAEVASYIEWLSADDENKGEEPAVSVIAKKAAKLATGSAASAGGSKSGSSGSRSTFTGKRGDILAHIHEAFAAHPSGTFLTINKIADFESNEYTTDGVFRRPSQGAISARLFPQGDKKLNLGDSPIVEPAEQDGKKGARKL